jgi:benzoylformate decarboxylase
MLSKSRVCPAVGSVQRLSWEEQQAMAKLARHALLEQLICDGTKYVFGNPGTTEQGFMDALFDYTRLEYILCLHEGVAVSAADAYARATQKPAFIELHTAAGLGNGMGMLSKTAP